jgi:hypothetical protein
MEAENQPEVSATEQKATNDRLANRLKAKKNGGNRRYDGMNAIQNKGDLVERKPLTPFETYAQALLLSNEASYVN